MKYGVILYEVRDALGISNNEYLLLDAISKLESNRGWCNANASYLAWVVGITRRRIFDMFDRLVQAKLLEIRPSDSAKRVTKKFKEAAIHGNIPKNGDVTSPVTLRHRGGDVTSPGGSDVTSLGGDVTSPVSGDVTSPNNTVYNNTFILQSASSARAEKKSPVEILEIEPVDGHSGSASLDAPQKNGQASPGRGAASSNPSPNSAPPLPFAASPWAGVTPAEWADKLLPLCDDLPGNLDTAYYLGRCRDWSAEKGGKSADWLATAARFAHDDFRKNKLVTIKTQIGHDTDGNPTPYRSSIIDPAVIAARTERILRRLGEWPGA